MIGDSTTASPGPGNSARPTLTTDHCHQSSMKAGSTTNHPKKAAQKKVVPTSETENDRIFSRSRSNSGAGCCRERRTNPHNKTAAPSTHMPVGTLKKPHVSVCAIANTNRPTPIEAIGTLTGSTRSGRSSARDSTRMKAPSTIATIPTGMLTRNTDRHPKALISAAPIDGPSAAANAPLAPQMPTAIPRRSGGNAGSSNASAAGNCMAPPTDCSTREAMSVEASTLRPELSEPSKKTNNPMRKSRLRP